MFNFGREFNTAWPPKSQFSLHLSNYGKLLLEKCKTVQKPDGSQSHINDVILRSINFPREFGSNNCRIMNQPKDRFPLIQNHIRSAYPIIHERVLLLYLSFLEHKNKFGNHIEKDIYNGMTLIDFIERLLKKRCISFFGGTNEYYLLNGENKMGNYSRVGTEREIAPLLLQNVLSYDEIKMSSLLSVSSYTDFINNGTRDNYAVVETNTQAIEKSGVIMGYIGAFLHRPNVMDFQDIVITQTQNTIENGYGNEINAVAITREQDYRHLWKKFYEQKDYLYTDVRVDNRHFASLLNLAIFDNVTMKKRFAISFDTLLLESEGRAKAAGKQAYLHVVGIGLGVWRIADQQEQIFLETFNQRLKTLISKLSHISVVHFSWFHMNKCGDLINNGIVKSKEHPTGGIRTYLSKRNPADKLSGEHENMLLIVTYAWDGNALPGNEFWLHCLGNSSDSAAASCSLITEIQNGHINTEMINGTNLHIASEKYGVVHISDYAKNYC